jgi:hypothetical protein
MRRFTLWIAYAVLALCFLLPITAIALVEGWRFVAALVFVVGCAAAAMWRIERPRI